jgi:hypothetical protein
MGYPAATTSSPVSDNQTVRGSHALEIGLLMEGGLEPARGFSPAPKVAQALAVQFAVIAPNVPVVRLGPPAAK